MLEAHKEIIRGREVVPDDWSVLRLAEGETPEALARIQAEFKTVILAAKPDAELPF